MEIARPSRRNSYGVQVEDTQICVVMVGLPARGKSLIAQKGTPEPLHLPLQGAQILTSPLLSTKIPTMVVNQSRGLQCRKLPTKRYPATHGRIL